MRGVLSHLGVPSETAPHSCPNPDPPRLGAWSCICYGLMSHPKAGCDQGGQGSMRTRGRDPPEMLILGTLCTREVWPPSRTHVEIVVPGTSLGLDCGCWRKRMGEEAACSPQPSRHHMQNHPAWHNQKNSGVGVTGGEMSSSHHYQQEMRNHLVKERLYRRGDSLFLSLRSNSYTAQ